VGREDARAAVWRRFSRVRFGLVAGTGRAVCRQSAPQSDRACRSKRNRPRRMKGRAPSEHAAIISQPMQDWIVALIGVGGTLSGTGLGYRGARAINRDDRAAAMREQVRAAVADYFRMLVVSVAELRDLPPRKDPKALDQAVDKLRGEQAAWIARRRSEFRLAGDRYRQIASELAVVVVKLQTLPLPPDVRAAVDAGNHYVERLGENRTPDLLKEWSEIHDRMLKSFASLEEQPPRASVKRLPSRRRLSGQPPSVPDRHA
jgi:hypothetical protein